MPDYEFIKKRRNTFGGGIAFHINDPLPSWNVEIENASDIYAKMNIFFQ